MIISCFFIAFQVMVVTATLNSFTDICSKFQMWVRHSTHYRGHGGEVTRVCSHASLGVLTMCKTFISYSSAGKLSTIIPILWTSKQRL